MNTTLIISTPINDNPPGNFAERTATYYSVQEDGVTACTGSRTETCYGDWYLPSRAELYFLYQNRAVVRGFVSDDYWSSTELDTDWLGFSTSSNGTTKNNNNPRVGAIRSF